MVLFLLVVVLVLFVLLLVLVLVRMSSVKGLSNSVHDWKVVGSNFSQTHNFQNMSFSKNEKCLQNLYFCPNVNVPINNSAKNVERNLVSTFPRISRHLGVHLVMGNLRSFYCRILYYIYYRWR